MYYNAWLYCESCSTTIHHPIWICVGDGEHRSFCRRCAIDLDRTFTPEEAIIQACAIVLIEHAVSSGRLVREGGVQW